MNNSKRPTAEPKEVKAILFSLVFLVLGFLVVWIAKKVVNIEGDAIYITLIFIPVLVYVIISGRLTEFKGPGGIEARFSEAASQSVIPSSETVEPSVEEMQIMEKEGLRVLQQRKLEIDKTRPLIMTIILGKENYYVRRAVIEYLKFLEQYPNFKFVVFLDKNNRFVAYMPSWAFTRVINLPELGDEFIQIINSGHTQDFYLFPGIIKDTISTRSTNTEALQQMTKEHLEAIVVIDEDRKLKGVIEREQITSKLLLTLIR
jgi:hypothetical protein